jgi:MADS-box transcription factor
MRVAAPSASPPISNGVIPFQHRQPTPQPQLGSRPSSRNNIRRPSSNLAPQHQAHQVTHAQPMPSANGFAYMPNPSLYNPNATHGMPGGPLPSSQPGHHPLYQYSHPPVQHGPPLHQQQQPHPQLQHTYVQDTRGNSMPPNFPPHERSQTQPQQTQQRHTPSPPRPVPQQQPPVQEAQPHQPKPMPAKSRSIFTPIDDSRSLLALQWGIGAQTSEPRSVEVARAERDNRSQSVDMGSVQRNNGSVPNVRTPRIVQAPQRGQSVSSLAGDSKRPRLKVQIPSEQSDDGGSATAGSSPRATGDTAGETPARTSTEASHSSGVVLPPPSPSASALLSAGAQGPPNPFARPPIPVNPGSQNSQAYNNNNNIETPISALPSRFVADGLLPSPSSFYPEWNFGRSAVDGNMLPSPLNFQTPVVSTGPSFLRDDGEDRKRKSPEGDGQQEGSLKRIKT